MLLAKFSCLTLTKMICLISNVLYELQNKSNWKIQKNTFWSSQWINISNRFGSWLSDCFPRSTFESHGIFMPNIQTKFNLCVIFYMLIKRLAPLSILKLHGRFHAETSSVGLRLSHWFTALASAKSRLALVGEIANTCNKLCLLNENERLLFFG